MGGEGGVNPSGQPDCFFPVFFIDDFPQSSSIFLSLTMNDRIRSIFRTTTVECKSGYGLETETEVDKDKDNAHLQPIVSDQLSEILLPCILSFRLRC